MFFSDEVLLEKIQHGGDISFSVKSVHFRGERVSDPEA